MILPEFPPNLVTIKFILGLPPLTEEPFDLEIDNGTVREMFLEEVEAEMEEHGDMVMLPVNHLALAVWSTI